MDELMDEIKVELKEGASASLTMTMSQELVTQFAELSGDHNPIHVDENYAKTTKFGRCIAHGAMLNGMFSKIAGTELPGPGSVVLNAQFDYKIPAYIGDAVTATMTVRRYRKDKPIIFMDCLALNQLGETLIVGTVVIYKMPT